jgi:hypothetical protein
LTATIDGDRCYLPAHPLRVLLRTVKGSSEKEGRKAASFIRRAFTNRMLEEKATADACGYLFKYRVKMLTWHSF